MKNFVIQKNIGIMINFVINKFFFQKLFIHLKGILKAWYYNTKNKKCQYSALSLKM